MIISSLEIVNIRSYTNEKINFKEGITFLSGDIGSGKSSILQAIEFSLFGFKRGDLEGFHLLRKGENRGEVSITLLDSGNKVKITRKIKKTKQGIVQENGYIIINSQESELSPSDLTAQIFEILKLPKEFLTKDRNLLYRFSTYTPQEQLKEILYAEHEKRLEVIRKLFQIDKYKQLQGASDLYLKELRDRKLLLKGKLESNESIEEEYEKLQKELEELNQKLKIKEEKQLPFKEKINEYETKKSSISKKIEGYRVKELEFEKKYSLLQEYKNQKQQLQKELDELDIDKLQKEKEELIKTKEINQKVIEITEKQLFENHKKELEFENEINKFKQLREEFQVNSLKLELKKKEEEQLKELIKKNQVIIIKCRIKDLDVNLNKLRIKTNKIRKKETEFKTKIEELKELEITIKTNDLMLKHKEKHLQETYSLNECETCLQDVSIAQKSFIKESLKNQIEEVNTKNIAINQNITSLKNSIEVLELELKEKTSYLIQIETLEEKQHLQKKELDEENQKQKEYTENLENTKKIITQLKEITKNNTSEEEKQIEENQKLLIKENDSNKEKIQEIKLKQQNIIYKLEGIKKQVEQKDTYKIKIDKINSSLQKEELLESSLEKLKNALLVYKDKEKKLEEHLIKLKDKNQQISLNIRELHTSLLSKKEINETLTKKIDKYKIQKKDLESIEIEYSFLEQKVIPGSSTIEKTLFTKFWVEFNEHFIAIFKELIEDQEFDVYLRDDFSIVVEQNGYEIDISNLSGGEKSSLAVAYRLALKKIIESNLGSQNILDILILDEPTDGFSEQQVSRLGYLLKDSGVGQILLVSHDEKIESIADNILHVEKKNHVSSLI